MATTGAVKGNLLGIYVGTDLIACATNSTFNGSNGTIDATCKDNDGARQVLMGEQTWTMQHDGILAFDAAYGYVDLVTIWKNKTSVTLKFSTEVTGDTYLTGDAFISSLDVTAGLNEVSTYSISFEGTGVLTIATVS